MVAAKGYYSYVCAVVKDPGVLTADPELPFEELLQKFKPCELCPDCKVIRTERSRHCGICNVCVERFDHHCSWVNNCVGIYTHNYFLMFLTFTWVLVLEVLCIIMDVMGRGASANPSKNPLGALCFFGICNNSTFFMTVGFSNFILQTIFFVPLT